MKFFQILFITVVTLLEFFHLSNIRSKRIHLGQKCEIQKDVFEEYVRNNTFKRMLDAFLKLHNAPTWLQGLVNYKEPRTPACPLHIEAQTQENWVIAIGVTSLAFFVLYGLAIFVWSRFKVEEPATRVEEIVDEESVITNVRDEEISGKLEDEEALEGKDKLQDEEAIEGKDKLQDEEVPNVSDKLQDEEALEGKDKLQDEEALEDKDKLQDEEALEDKDNLQAEAVISETKEALSTKNKELIQTSDYSEEKKKWLEMLQFEKPEPAFGADLVVNLRTRNGENWDLVDVWDGTCSRRCYRRQTFNKDFTNMEAVDILQKLAVTDGVPRLITYNENGLFFTQPPCNSQPWKKYFEKDGLTLPSAMDAFLAVLQRLKLVNELGIAVNDLCMDYIYLRTVGDSIEAYIANLPLARYFGSSAEWKGDLSKKEKNNIPPELLKGEEIGAKSDVFSFGRLLLLTAKDLDDNETGLAEILITLAKDVAAQRENDRPTLDTLMELFEAYRAAVEIEK